VEFVALESFFGYTGIDTIIIRNLSMTAEAVLFAGVRFSSGRKPVTFAALDNELNVVLLTQWDISEVIRCLREYKSVQLAVHSASSRTGQVLYDEFQRQLIETGFHPYSTKEGMRLWIESMADRCYRVFQPSLFPRQSLEGRLQRALILYDEGMQIPDPMDFFEEITRHKLLQGVLPAENIYSSRQLDALAMAYVAWMARRPAETMTSRDKSLLPKFIATD
jgi:hypothetical protein